MPAKSKNSANPNKGEFQQRSPKINELLYKTLIDNIHLGITLIDANYKIITTNVGQDKLFRKPKGELIGKYCFREFEKRSKVCSHCPGTRTMATGRPAEAYAEGTRDDGSHIQAHLRTFPVFESDGSVSGFIEIVENITEYKRTEESLKESEQRFNAIFDNAPDGILLADAKTKKFHIGNKTICKMLGYKPEEIKNLAVKDIHPKESLSFTLKQFARQVAREITVDEGVPVKRKDGSIFYADISAFPITFSGKTYIAGIFRDVTERRWAEEKLKESEERFKAIFDNAADGILLTDAKTKKFYLGNKAVCKMLGYKPEEIKNRTVLDTVPKELSSYAIGQFGKIARGEISLVGSGDVPVRRKDGSIFYAAINAFPITFGGKTYITGVFRDITSQKKAEEALRTSEAQLSNAMKIAKLCYWEYDVAEDMFTFNDQFYSIFRTSAEKVGGYKMSSARYARQFLHPDDVYMVEEEIKKAIKTTDPHFSRLVEHRIIYADGEIGYMAVRHFVVKDKKGRTIKTFGANQDVTEYKKAQDELQQAEAKYRSLVEQIPAVTYTAALDKASTTTYVSPQILRLIGFSPKEYRADPDIWRKQLHPEDRQRVLDCLRRSHKNESPFICEYRMFGKDGRVVWCRDEAVIVRDNSGKPLMMQGVMFDITAQKQAEEELHMYREKMAQTERLASLGTLSATVAHELTQPLTVIRLSIENSLEDLAQTSCCKTAVDALRDALKEVGNATSAVDRFRNYARQSAGKNLCEANLVAIAGRIVRLLHKTAVRVNMTLILKDLDKLPPVYSNEKDLEQVFFALTENAIQAVDGKKRHRFIIGGSVKNKCVELQFIDNCSGIAPENLDKIFDPFFTTGSNDGRTGLGLPIVQRIVSGFGGKIRVRSQLGKGTTFYVTLPIHPEVIE
jgi:PAS domain S-box-containing protein